MAQGQQGDVSDGSLDTLWTIGLIVVVVVLVWYLGSATITRYGLTFKRWQLVAVRWWYTVLPAVQIDGLGVDTQRTAVEMDSMLDSIRRGMRMGVDFQEFSYVLGYVGSFWRYFYSAVAIGFICYLVFGSTSASNFRKVFNTATLRQSEQSNWPQITPVVKLDLVNTKLDEGPWAMSRSPMNYCKFHKLLIVNKNEYGNYDVKLDRRAASKLLEAQLGVKWQGIERLPDYAKALFAVFAARIVDDRKSAERLLDNIARSAGGEQLDFSGTDELLARYANHKLVQEIVGRHAYVNTVMASMLEGARSIGVLASSEFIWLKPVDRGLWYMLNSVGRSTAVAEICGAFAHWVAELRNGGPLFAPMIGEAIKGLEIALTELIYHPDEEE